MQNINYKSLSNEERQYYSKEEAIIVRNSHFPVVVVDSDGQFRIFDGYPHRYRDKVVKPNKEGKLEWTGDYEYRWRSFDQPVYGMVVEKEALPVWMQSMTSKTTPQRLRANKSQSNSEV